MKQLIIAIAILVLTCINSAHADEFQVLDIRIEGLQRVSAGTVFAALPINVGNVVDESAIRDATRSLFRTGYFADVIIARENGILVIGLVERPAVTEINIDGNKAIETDQLLDALRDNGLADVRFSVRSSLKAWAKNYSVSMSLKAATVPWWRLRLNPFREIELLLTSISTKAMLPKFVISTLLATKTFLSKNCWRGLSKTRLVGCPGSLVMISTLAKNSPAI